MSLATRHGGGGLGRADAAVSSGPRVGLRSGQGRGAREGWSRRLRVSVGRGLKRQGRSSATITSRALTEGGASRIAGLRRSLRSTQRPSGRISRQVQGPAGGKADCLLLRERREIMESQYGPIPIVICSVGCGTKASW